MFLLRFVSSLFSLVSCSLLLGSDFCRPHFWDVNRLISLSVDALYYRYQGSGNTILVDRYNTIPLEGKIIEPNVLNTSQLDKRMRWTEGLDGSLKVMLNSRNGLEFSYTYLRPWKASKKVIREGCLAYPFDPLYEHVFYNLHPAMFDLINAHRVDAKCRSHMQWGEINYFRFLSPRRVDYFSTAWGLGMRGIKVAEQFDMLFFGTDYRPPYWERRSPYNTKTDNIFVGPQLLLLFEGNPFSWFTIGGEFKCAGMADFASVDVLILDFNGLVPTRQYKKHKTVASLALEGQCYFQLHFGNWVDLTIGYKALFIDQIFRAARQFSSNVANRSFTRGRGEILLIDGAYAGISFGF